MVATTESIFFNKLYKLINCIFLCLYDNLILCQHLFIQIYTDSNIFHKDGVKIVQDANIILELVEASPENAIDR